jgi:tripartite-type tricarboxylate transporter receptor subunit TctC
MLAAAHAQTGTARPVRIVIPFAPGGGSDVVGRILAQKLGETSGQTFIVDNRPGASGNIAFEFVARAEPDGYTLMNSTPGLVTNPNLYRKVNYKIEDFVAITLIGEAPLAISVHPSLPVNSIAELVQLAKRKPGEVRYGSVGAGSSSHLATELFLSMAGLQMVHVPYKGGPAVLQDVISGQVEMTSLPLTESMPQVRAKRVRALAQTGAQRSSLAPDLPTMEESGFKGYAISTWYVIIGPAAIPSEMVNRLNDDIVKVLKFPDVQERLKAAGIGDVIGSKPSEAAQFLKAEYAKWTKLIQTSGIKAE